MLCEWIEPVVGPGPEVRAIAGELGLPEPLAAILATRGHVTPGEASAFLSPRLQDLSAPEDLEGVAGAASTIARAIRENHRIVLYGDYDVDGVASAAFLQRVLSGLGGRVEAFVPSRAEEGYGLSHAAVQRCCEEFRPDLLVAVDCGTNSPSEIARLAAMGIPAVILDHHEPEGARPDAIIVNPKLSGSPLRYLCSAGVAFKVAHALVKMTSRARSTPQVDLREFLDLVALATVADMVPLIGENRILVHRGLQQLPHTRWPGLRALMSVASVNGTVRGSDIGFRLGPRINASGRLGTAKESLDLLLTDDPAVASRIAASLDRQNRERQAVERSVAMEAEEWLEPRFNPGRDTTIVAGARDWHPGVLGIVAARIMRRHHRPTIVVGFDDSGMGRGSCRSIEGFSLVDALARCSDLLEKFGGHELAAGLSVREDRFEDFRAAFEEAGRATVDPATMTPRLRLDAELDLSEITDSFLQAMDRLEPFGNSNDQPVFFSRGLVPSLAPKVLKEKHLKLEFREGRARLDAIYFHADLADLPRPPWDVAFRAERNTFNGRTLPQLQIVAIRAAT
ncbi:MAG: single-stranded-DNA-specific exonuclease RecJ [Terrimicrobiaceae bacterium]